VLKAVAFPVSVLLVALPVFGQAQPCERRTNDSWPTSAPDPPIRPGTGILLAPLGEEYEAVSIRSSPPTMWLVGFPGPEVNTIQAGDCYRVVDGLEVHAFGSTDVWVKIEQLTGTDDESKSGWIEWGESPDGIHPSLVPAVER